MVEVAPRQGGLLEVCGLQLSIAEHGITKVSAPKICIVERSPSKIGSLSACLEERGGLNSRANKISAVQDRVFEVDGAEVGIGEIRARKN